MHEFSCSVVIPAWNAARTLGRCLDALREQTLPAVEIIVVDDGSTDETARIARERGVTVLPNTRAKGAGGARNTGAFAARGEVLAFTDSDCVPPSDWVAKIAAALRDPGVAAVAGSYSGHVGASFIGRFAYRELHRRRRGFPRRVATAVSNNFAVRAEIFRRVGGFPENFAGATLEDMVLSYRVGRLGDIVWLADNGVGHHFHETFSGYLRQQYAFARDTVRAYFDLPDLRRVKTHQGRLIYIETTIAGLILPALAFPLLAAAVLAVLWCLNLALLADIWKREGPLDAIRAFLFIPVRDLNWVRGVAAGFLKAARRKPRRKKPLR